MDPLAIEPYVAQARWSGTLENALVPLRQAVELQPRSYAAHYLYGIDLLKVGRRLEPDVKGGGRFERRQDGSPYLASLATSA